MTAEMEPTSVQEILRELPPLETERLVLRRMTMDDAEDMFEYASDPEVARYTTWEAHKTIEDSRAFLARAEEWARSGEIANWGVEHKADRKFIGTCGLIIHSFRDARAELAYAISRRYWGQGLVTEAASAALEFGFCTLGLNRIEARCIPENVGSYRVMEKIGMTYEGTLREHERIKGEFVDLKLYSILRREWKGDFEL